MAWSPRGRFVPDSTIRRRMDAKDARINREIAARQRQIDRAHQEGWCDAGCACSSGCGPCGRCCDGRCVGAKVSV